MFKPNYQLSQKLLGNIAFSERLYGQLEALKIPKNIELNLERTNEIKSSYISNSIEGNPLSLPEVTNLLLDERLPANRDEKEVYNYFQILRNLHEYLSKPISLQTVLNIHQDLMMGVQDKIAGKIRDKAIIVGKYETTEGKVSLKIKHNPPAHKKEQITHLLQELLDWLNKSKEPAILKAGIFHHQFVYIHPLEDGNGRTCRLLTALLFAQEKYDINKYFVLDDYYDVDRPAYSDALHSADEGEQTKWLEYFSDGVKYSLQSALSKVKNALSTLSPNQRPTPKEKIVLELLQTYGELTSADIAKRLHLSRQQAHNLLSALIKKGFVDKKGSTKASYYFLK